MKAENFEDLYRRTYAILGHSLTSRDGIPLDEFEAAEKRLGIRLPTALRAYYLVAGRERSLNHAHNRLCALGDWQMHAGKLVFMEENQWAVVWGIAAGGEQADNPPVYQGPVVDGEPSGWFLEERECSAFMVFMLHLQAAFGGGMPFIASGPAPQSLVATLDAQWNFGGEVNGMRAYSRDKQAVCFVKWQDFFAKEKSWRVFAGACDKAALQAIAMNLNLQWD
ncbi:MAG: hypothetical protein C5B50_29335 [Verrucomicrobia bacterium]|nr:MAG: hypothetical protein C5B50_29335 [Verrucomicrobiota bacterium]